ncbi:MAG: DUF4336 domain-containing protein [Proteobacteria bacterium]|nr:DUF4336 domain-containing protein [Pseudomonadota bacterium]
MLELIADDLWGAEYDLFMFKLLHFRGRMTVIRLADGSLLLHSPIPIDEALAAELARLGEVRHIVAPNCLHHLHLPGAIERYPSARVWGAPGLAKKRKDIEFDGYLSAEPAPEWPDELQPLAIEGVPWAGEFVFLHVPSATLLCTDLIFNIDQVQGWLTRLLLRLVGAYRRVAQSKMWRIKTTDRTAAARSIEQLLAWQFDRVVMAHGSILERDGHAILEGVVGGMRGRKPLAAPTASA